MKCLTNYYIVKTNKIKYPIKYNFLLLFMFCFCYLNIIKVSVVYIVPLVIVILFWFYKHNSWKQLLISAIIGAIPIELSYVIQDYNLFTHIIPAIDNLLHFSVRNYLIGFVNSSYDLENSSVINLLIFNVKQDVAKEIYQMMIDISIVYLIVVGGMHLSFVQNFLLRVVKKHKLPVIIFNNVFCFFYTYLLNFSISTSRVLLSNGCGLLKLKWKLSPYDQCALAGVISMFIYPNVITNIGFNLSYLCSLGIIFVYQLKIKNYFLRALCINAFSFLISLPYVVQMNQSISIFAIINSFLFSYFIIIIFIVLILTFWIKWIYPFQQWISTALIFIVGGFNVLNVKVYLQPMPAVVNAAFFSIILAFTIYLANRRNFYLKY